jgi:hypothetical protein
MHDIPTPEAAAWLVVVSNIRERLGALPPPQVEAAASHWLVEVAKTVEVGGCLGGRVVMPCGRTDERARECVCLCLFACERLSVSECLRECVIMRVGKDLC